MPVRPPMPNIGMNAVAKSIGTVNRIDAPQSESMRAVSRITDGIEMMIVVVWKKAATVAPMPVIYIWWAQTMKERKARTSRAMTMAL